MKDFLYVYLRTTENCTTVNCELFLNLHPPFLRGLFRETLERGVASRVTWLVVVKLVIEDVACSSDFPMEKEIQGEIS